MKLIEACELVFVAEGVLNVVSGTLLTFFPAFVMAQQGLPATVPPHFFKFIYLFNNQFINKINHVAKINF
jgi:hypothetical protein